MVRLKEKRIFVAGGNGFMGSHLIAALHKRGVPKDHIIAPRSNECDFRVWDECARALKGAEVVFDCAAIAGDLLTRTKIPGEIFYDNLVMGIHILEAARQAGAEKVVTVGSVSEYPDTAPLPLKEDDLWAGLPASTNIPYGLSKRIVAIQGEMYRKQSGFNAVHLLLANSYGPGEKYESGYMLPSLIKKILDAKKANAPRVEVWGTGDQTRDLIFVDDAVEGILLAAEKYEEKGPLNLATGAGIRIKDLIALLCSIIGFEGKIKWDTTKPEGTLQRTVNIDKAKRTIGFEAKTPLEEGLRQTMGWHRSTDNK